MKKSEKQAKEALRQVTGRNGDMDRVTVVTKKGAHIEGNQGQSVKQGFGSGLKDIAAALKPKKK